RENLGSQNDSPRSRNRIYKSIALKSKISSKEDDSEEDGDVSDDGFELFAHRLRRMMMFKKKENKSSSNDNKKYQSKVIFYNCREPNQYKSNCPRKKKEEINKKEKKKVLMASWEDLENDSNDHDSDQEVQLCLMDDSTEYDEVDFSNLSNKELLDMIDDLNENSGKLFEKYTKLKNENEALKDEMLNSLCN
ncbi:hypothetical protein PIB30_020315, partial [Stylosanthes scabra]|nr:hypothetical protein [Stylosanthes scabra]